MTPSPLVRAATTNSCTVRRSVRVAPVLVAAELLCIWHASAFAAGPDPKGNDCAQSYWRDTLRCAAFPSDPPQPNFEDSPATVADIRAYTRVFMGKYSLRTLDGTRPVLYIDKALCTTPAGCGAAAFGDPVESDKWLLSVTGGGSCEAIDSDDDGKADDADSCLLLYEDPTERDEMGSADKAPMKNLVGIMADDPSGNPAFAGYNRVRVEKVSYDRYNGLVKYHRTGGYFTGLTSGAVTVHFDLYQQGYRIMRETLRMLEKGLTYTTWRDDGVGAVEAVEETLPTLSAADSVVFVGHSGGAHGLYHNIDRLADHLQKKKDFTGDVRAIFDANFLPSIANEAAFATDAMAVPLAGDIYSDQWAGNTSAGGIAFAYDGADYYATGDVSAQYDTFGGDRILDRSCLDTHKRTDGATWKCRDRVHVLSNHVATPFFFREDFTDPSTEHTANGSGHRLVWGEYGPWPHCPVGVDCPPVFDLVEQRARLTQQAETLLDDRATRSEIALGIDESLGGAGAFPSFYAWMPDCGTHSGAYNNVSWNTQAISWQGSDWTMREWVEDFLVQPRLGVAARRIDGVSDGLGTATSSCPP